MYLYLFISLSLCADIEVEIEVEHREIFTLDISREGSCREYMFGRDGEVQTYLCNSGFLISKLDDGNSEIWKGDDFGIRVEVYISTKKEYRVAILHESRTYSLFERYRPPLSWSNITRQQLDVERITVYDHDLVELHNYRRDLSGMSYGLVLIPPNEWHQVRFNNHIIWDYGKRLHIGAIASIWIDLIRGGMFLRIMYRGGRYQIGPEDGLKFYEGNEEFGPSGYRKTKHDQRMNFMLRRSCTRVKYYGDIIWEHEGGPFPNVIVFNRNPDIIEIRFNWEKIECKVIDGIWHQDRMRYQHQSEPRGFN